MIVKILKSASAAFEGVLYNERKIKNETGELLTMKNFPPNIDHYSSQEDVRNYFQSIAAQGKTNRPQFHATISTKFKEHNAEQLDQIGQLFMSKMGYANQPYIIVFHNDTDNNHIHIVSTRVDKHTGKRLSDSFERVKARKALKESLKELRIKDVDTGKIDDLTKLLSYRYSTFNQLKELLNQNNFRIEERDGAYRVFQDGALYTTLNPNQINFNTGTLERRNQVRAILYKYKNVYSNKAFKVEDKRDIKPWQTEREKAHKTKLAWESELQYQLKEKFGLEIIFHHKDNKPPFGYTIMDHKDKTIWKGSELLKLANLFEFTDDTIDKKTFEILKDYNVSTESAKQELLDFFNRSKYFMIFSTKTHKSKRQIAEAKAELLRYLSGAKDTGVRISDPKADDPIAIIPDQHYIGKMSAILGATFYQAYQDSKANGKPFSVKGLAQPTTANAKSTNRLSSGQNAQAQSSDADTTTLSTMLSTIADIVLTPTYTTPEEDFKNPLHKKRKKRR